MQADVSVQDGVGAVIVAVGANVADKKHDSMMDCALYELEHNNDRGVGEMEAGLFAWGKVGDVGDDEGEDDGSLVGFAVGEATGILLGELDVGLLVGEVVGRLEVGDIVVVFRDGDALGEKDGLREGARLGDFDGKLVPGALVGLDEGLCVGDFDGFELTGEVEGWNVAPTRVGLALGDRIGLLLGLWLGEALG